MNAEHLLDAIGLLDDSLIREAEEYRRPQARRSYGVWLGWAASFAVVLVLGYGLTHLGMGGGNSMAPAAPSGGNAASTPAASAPPADYAPSGSGTGGNALPAEDRDPASGETSEPANPETPEPDVPGNGCDMLDGAVEIFGMESGQIPAIMVDGTLYWYSAEITVARPEELEVRGSTSSTEGEPEEDGQINFPKEGVRYVLLEEGRVGVNWNGGYEWYVFTPEPPRKP